MNIPKNKKLSHKKYFDKFNHQQEEFLLKRFEEEWLEIQKVTNRDRQIEKLRGLGVDIGKILLGIAAIGGILMIAMIAPNILVVFGRSRKKLGYFDKKDFENHQLSNRKNGHLKFTNNGENNYTVELTNRGKRNFLKSFAKSIKIKPNNNWGGKWWLVTFDIPKKYSNCRDMFRERLKLIGMYQLQESVFISRYACADEVLFWASVYNISFFVQIAQADFITSNNFPQI